MAKFQIFMSQYSSLSLRTFFSSTEGFRGGLRLKACMDPYTKQFIKLEEERIKNDQKRNSELSVIRVNLQQGTAELAEIRQTMQEMLAVMKQMLGSNQ